jgi:hypothetical protein
MKIAEKSNLESKLLTHINQREAVMVWEDYQKTGLHLTLEEADEWLAKLESANDREPPACHV